MIEASNSYKLMPLDETINDSSASINTLPSKFKCLSRIIAYLPMIATRSAQNSRRSPYFVGFLSILILLWTLFSCCYRFYYDSLQPLMSYDDDAAVVYAILYAIKRISYTLSRITSLYYYYYRFNYTWNADNLQLIELPSDKFKLKCYTIMIYLMIILMVFGGFMEAVTFYYKGRGGTGVDYAIVALIDLILVMTPIHVTFGAAGAMFIYYYTVCCKFVQDIKDKENVNFNDMYDNYKKCVKSLKINYHPSLRWTIHFRFIGVALHVWIVFYDITQNNDSEYDDYWAALVYVSSCIVFVTPSSLIVGAFEEYYQELFEYGEKYMNGDNNDLKDEYIKYDHLYRFVSRDALQITIGSFKVTNYNFLKFCMWYVILRLLSHSFGLLYGW